MPRGYVPAAEVAAAIRRVKAEDGSLDDGILEFIAAIGLLTANGDVCEDGSQGDEVTGNDRALMLARQIMNRQRYSEMLAEGERARNVSCIVWDEDVHNHGEIISYCEDLHMECVVSPLHDQDTYTPEDVRKWVRRHIDPDTGDVSESDRERAPKVGDAKKAHTHVLLRSKGPKYGKDWSELMAGLVVIPETKWRKINDWDVMVRYMAHLDHPYKAQYSPLSVTGLGGTDLSALLKNKASAKIEVMARVRADITRLGITNFDDLDNYVWTTGDIDYISCLTGRHAYFNALLRERRNKRIWQLKRAARDRGEEVTDDIKYDIDY